MHYCTANCYDELGKKICKIENPKPEPIGELMVSVELTDQLNSAIRMLDTSRDKLRGAIHNLDDAICTRDEAQTELNRAQLIKNQIQTEFDNAVANLNKLLVVVEPIQQDSFTDNIGREE